MVLSLPPTMRQTCLIAELNDLIGQYGWQAVVTELAQTALDYGDPGAADSLLQAAYAPNKLGKATLSRDKGIGEKQAQPINQKSVPINVSPKQSGLRQ